MRRYLLAVLVVVFSADPARAEVKLHSLFTDHAVLQRGQPIPVWGRADADSEVTVSFRQAKVSVKANATGRWKVELPAQSAGGPDELTVSSNGQSLTVKDILVGEVWVCSGQSNMEWSIRGSQDPDMHIAAAKIPRMRLFQVPRRADTTPHEAINSKWRECTPQSAANFSAVGFFFGRNLHLALDVPVGLIHTSWGGTPAEAWTSAEALNAESSLRYYHEELAKKIAQFDPERSKTDHEAALEKHKAAVAQAKEEGKNPPRAPQMKSDPRQLPNPSTLYNGMLAPLIPYGIRGAIWYQGESNGWKGYEYRTLFSTMIKDWRTRWGQGDFPFLCVQLAPFNNNNPDGPQWAELREAQLLTTKTMPNVGMAVTTDIGEKDDIHPKKKEHVGARLALLARTMAYGENIPANGPIYKSMSVVNNRTVLSFECVEGGLVSKGGPLTGFTVCDEDHKFVPAKAEIQGATVVVTADGIEKPVAVRYGWKNCPEVNLFNKAGLPASPFRTDDFPLVSGPKK